MADIVYSGTAYSLYTIREESIAVVDADSQNLRKRSI